METNHIWLSCAHYVAIYLSMSERRILGTRVSSDYLWFSYSGETGKCLPQLLCT